MEWRVPTRNKKGIKLEVDPGQLDEITGAYLTAFQKGKDGISYLLSTDSDVTIERNGLLRASPPETYPGLKGQVLCLIEMLNTEQYTEYVAPVLYNNELCSMHIAFDEDNPDGEIQAVVPAAVTKKEYEVKEGDTIVPLYLLSEKEKGNKNVYQDSYYMGEPISINSLASGDALLEQIPVDEDTCTFGFMIQDTKQHLYYTECAD